MKIGIMSDSHGNYEALRLAVESFGHIDAILHAGDILYHPPRLQNFKGYDLVKSVDFLNSLSVPIIACQGNCDSDVYTELLPFYEGRITNIYAVKDFNIIINHGHKLNEAAMVSLAKDNNAKIFLSGHTHVPVLYKKDGVVLLNPGSIAIPRFPDVFPDPTASVIESGMIKIYSINTGKVYFEIDI